MGHRRKMKERIPGITCKAYFPNATATASRPIKPDLNVVNVNV
jgi:hypothetical protein